MANLLLTGGRAPATLELARLMRAAGHRVVMAESAALHLTQPSAAIQRHYRVPAPRQAPAAFGAALLRICAAENIDLVIPTCEEVFYVAQIHDRLPGRVFGEPLERLRPLHSKWDFVQRARRYGLSVPATQLLTSTAERDAVLPEAGDLVFKPVYSRFAAKTVIRPTRAQAEAVLPSPQNPWVAQAFIPGRQFCSYSLAHAGRLAAHTVYLTEFTAGQGSTIAFQHHPHAAIQRWVDQFVAQEQFTGQIAFDFIESAAGQVTALECNPRTTSGLHLLAAEPGLAQAFLACPEQPITPAAGARPQLLALAMWVYGLPALRTPARFRRWAELMRAGRDVIFRLNDPLPALWQWVGLGYFLGQSWRRRITPLEASTYDIEWNGPAA